MANNTKWNFKQRRGENHVSIGDVNETEIVPGYVNQNGEAIFADLYGLIIANTSSSPCNVTIRDVMGGTPKDVIAVPAGETRGWTLPKESARVQANGNKQWTAKCSAAVSLIEITALFFSNS